MGNEQADNESPGSGEHDEATARLTVPCSTADASSYENSSEYTLFWYEMEDRLSSKDYRRTVIDLVTEETKDLRRKLSTCL